MNKRQRKNRSRTMYWESAPIWVPRTDGLEGPIRIRMSIESLRKMADTATGIPAGFMKD